MFVCFSVCCGFIVCLFICLFLTILTACPGTYTSEMSVCLNDNPSLYKVILSGTMKSPKINFDPPFLMLMPVPLDVKTETAISIIPQDYLRYKSQNNFFMEMLNNSWFCSLLKKWINFCLWRLVLIFCSSE